MRVFYAVVDGGVIIPRNHLGEVNGGKHTTGLSVDVCGSYLFGVKNTDPRILP